MPSERRGGCSEASRVFMKEDSNETAAGANRGQFGFGRILGGGLPRTGGAARGYPGAEWETSKS